MLVSVVKVCFGFTQSLKSIAPKADTCRKRITEAETMAELFVVQPELESLPDPPEVTRAP